MMIILLIRGLTTRKTLLNKAKAAPENRNTGRTLARPYERIISSDSEPGPGLSWLAVSRESVNYFPLKLTANTNQTLTSEHEPDGYRQSGRNIYL